MPTFRLSLRYLTLHGKGKSVRLVDIATLRTVQTVEPLRNGELNDVFFAADGSVLLVHETIRP